MASYRIEIGKTDGFRYIGIQPPVAEEEKEVILRALGERVRTEAVGNGVCLAKINPFSGESYQELGLSSWRELEDPHRTHKIGTVIGATLVGLGHEVTFDMTPKDIGFGRDLFGGRARVLG